MAMTEEQLMQAVYSDYEGDVDDWETDSDEYEAARRFANKGISVWENHDNTSWRVLWVMLSDAADGDKTTDGTLNYDCPTNFVRPGGYVLVDTTVYDVITPEKVQVRRETDPAGRWCYFTGSPKTGFDLHFNPELTMSTGDTIEYPYYKSATTLTTTTSTTEIPDPYMLEEYVLYRLYLNDGELELAKEAKDSWKEKLETMKTHNMSGIFGVKDIIEETLSENDGLAI